MKNNTNRMSSFISKFVGSGNCRMCGKFSVLGLKLKFDKIICFVCIQKLSGYLSKKMFGSAIGNMYDEDEEIVRPKKKKKRKRIPLADFDEDEINQMSRGAVRKKGPETEGDDNFGWEDPNK